MLFILRRQKHINEIISVIIEKTMYKTTDSASFFLLDFLVIKATLDHHNKIIGIIMF